MEYDSANEIERNEIQHLISNCQKSIDAKDQEFMFVFKQLVDVFAVMAFDKLKSMKRDLNAVAKCEEIIPLFENCMTILTCVMTPFNINKHHYIC